MRGLQHIQVKAAPDSRVRATVFLSQQNSILVKDEFGYLFLFLGNERSQRKLLREKNPTLASTEPAGRPGLPAPLLPTAASPDSQDDLKQLRMKTTTWSTVLRLSLVFSLKCLKVGMGR